MVTDSKGYYRLKLRDLGITKHEGKSLKVYKTYVLRNLYHNAIKQGGSN